MTKVHISPGLAKLPETIQAGADLFQQNVALEVHSDIVELTPVDAGTARSNWVARIGSPFSLIYRAFAPGKFLGRGESANAKAAKAQANGVISTHKGGKPIYLSNNVPYIGRLNDGYSRQTPANFVKRGISTGVARAKAKGFRIYGK